MHDVSRYLVLFVRFSKLFFPCPVMPPLTVQLMLRCAETFDPEAIFSLNLSEQKLTRLGDCINLLTSAKLIDLSGNALTDVSAMDPRRLHALRTLNLSSNRISQLSGRFGAFKSLRTLHLENNDIRTLKELSGFTALPQLRALYLQKLDNTMQNPVCAHKGYRAAVLKLLPNLTVLDGERVKSVHSLTAISQQIKRAYVSLDFDVTADNSQADWFGVDDWPDEAEWTPALRTEINECKNVMRACEEISAECDDILQRLMDNMAHEERLLAAKHKRSAGDAATDEKS